jgi:hypothetical protein
MQRARITGILHLQAEMSMGGPGLPTFTFEMVRRGESGGEKFFIEELGKKGGI